MKVVVSRLFGRLIERTFLHEIPMRSGAVAFAALFAIGPLLLMLMAAFATFNLDLRTELNYEIQRLFGETGSALLNQISSEDGRVAARIGWSSLIIFIISAGAIFSQIHETLIKIFGADDPPKTNDFSFFSEVKIFFKTKFFSFVIVLCFIVLCVFSLIISSLISIFLSGNHLILGGALDDFLTLSGFGLVFSILIRYASSRRVSWPISFIGGFFTSFLFTVGKRGISVYLAQSQIDNLYGTAGSLAGLLVWIYYSSLIFFLGAELSAVLSNHRKCTG